VLSWIPPSPRRLLVAAATWHLTSQQQARRNALVGSTRLARSRQERLEVEAFLSSLEAERAGGQPASGASRTA
jgi:hypothetical protein